MSGARSLTLACSLLLVASARAAPCNAQSARPSIGTATGLEAIASDGTRVRIGSISGVIRLEPATRPAARFGRIRVRAGLEIDAVAGPEAELPAFVRGEIASILRAGDETREARLRALHRRGRRLVARIQLGDAMLEDVPVLADQLRVEGALEEERSIAWDETAEQLRPGHTRLCAAPARRCVALSSPTGVPVRVVERRRGWAHVVAEAPGLRLEGWTPARRVVGSAPLDSSAAGRIGAISSGCPYQGSPAMVAAGTAVSLQPDGAVWARVPDAADSVWVYDSRPGSPWVEITFARGVDRAYPASTCSLGWVPRRSVTFHHFREGELWFAHEPDGEGRPVVVLHTLPTWLREAGLAPGDRLLGQIERGVRREPHDLDDLRSSLGIGGTFVVSRDGSEHTIRVPLAPGCDEPGAAQPVACQPR